MALNIRKVTAQRAENIQKKYKKDNFYICLLYTSDAADE